MKSSKRSVKKSKRGAVDAKVVVPDGLYRIEGYNPNGEPGSLTVVALGPVHAIRRATDAGLVSDKSFINSVVRVCDVNVR